MSDGKVVIATELDSDGAVKGMNRLEKSITPALKRIASLVAVAFSVKALVGFGKQAVELASDLQEVQNVVDTAFGDMAYKMEEFADTAIEQFGISRLEAKRTGSTFMAMAGGMGIAMDSASDMAIALTGLSADMASFYNVRQDVASTALKSIFTGETETLKQFGIVMTETNLQAFAYSQGINKTLKNMTQAEKTQLRYNYVMAQTSLAQGDFAKTSNSWANQTRILGERWKELLGIMGNGLVKILTPVLQMMNQLLASAIDLGNALASAFGFDFETTSTTPANVMSDLADATDDATDSAKALKKANDKLVGGYDKLNVISKDTSDSTASASTGVGAGAVSTVTSQTSKESEKSASSISKLKDALEDLAKISLTNLVEALTGLKEQLIEFGKNIADGLLWIYDNVLVPLAEWTIEDVLPAFINLLTASFELLNAVIEDFKPLWNFIWDNFLKPVAEFTGDAFVGVLNALADFISFVANNEIALSLLEGFAIAIGAVTTALVAYKTALTGAKAAMTLFTTALGLLTSPAGIAVVAITAISTAIILIAKNWKTVKSALNSVAQFFKTKFTAGAKAIKSAFSGIKKFFADIWKGIKSVFRSVTTWFGNKFKAVVSAISTAVSGIGSIFSAVWNAIKLPFNAVSTFFQSVISGIKAPFKGIANWFKSVFQTAWQGVKNVFSKGGKVFTGITTGILKTFKSVVNALIDGINDVVTVPFDGINGAFKKMKKVKISTPFGSIKPFSFLPTIPTPQIPKLATGAVLPANNPFMAIVGDQKHGTNVETPLSTMIEAFNTALDKRGEGVPQTINLTISGKTVATVVWDESKKLYKQSGKYIPV